MYVLTVDNKEELEKAVDILRVNGINAGIESALKLVCYEEAINIAETKHDHLNAEQMNSFVDCLTHELYDNSCNIFDEEYMDELGNNVERIVKES